MESAMTTPPSPLTTIRAMAVGYAPRVLQARGWILAASAVGPVLLVVGVTLLSRMEGADFTPRDALQIFHEILRVLLPIMALVAAPAGIREDLEQRTLPLLLARPATTWALPLGKGLPWFLWGAGWLILALLGLFAFAGDPSQLPGRLGAMVGAWWGELAFMTLAGLLFKRGALWGALYFFLWEPLVRVFPAFLQRLTFSHYIESLTGTRATSVQTHQMLAQEQVTTHPVLAFLVLIAFGALCWGLAGWKLHRTPIGLAGSEAEG